MGKRARRRPRLAVYVEAMHWRLRELRAEAAKAEQMELGTQTAELQASVCDGRLAAAFASSQAGSHIAA